MKKSNLTPANAAARKWLTDRQTALLTVCSDELTYKTRSDIGGKAMSTYRDLSHAAANGHCVACKQAVSLTVPAHAVNASTVGTLIPCAMSGNSESRYGYGIAGNTATFCRACVNLSNTAREDGTVFVWGADCIDAWSVLTVWPSLPKRKGTRETTASTVDPAAWIATCVRVLALRGVVFNRA